MSSPVPASRPVPASFAEIAARVAERFPQAVVRTQTENIDPWLEIAPAEWHAVAAFLRDDPTLRFEQLACISGVDYCEVPGRKGKKPAWEPHIEVVYHFYGFSHRHRLTCKLLVPRLVAEAPEGLPEVPSVADLWRTADWHEREIYDLVGVRFAGHPELRRILCPEDWQGHPLRKDYEMPLEYHGIRGR